MGSSLDSFLETEGIFALSKMIPATSALKKQIDRSALNLVHFLEENATTEVFKFPHSFSFPRNCCEGASILFKELLQEKYGLSRALIVKGTNKKYQHHLWVELDGLVYDLTAHQFHPFKRPIIGVPGTALEKRFSVLKVNTSDPEFLDVAEISNLYHLGVFNF